MKRWLWGLAERADWYSWPPRRFWRWLLRRLDRAHGHNFTYDEVREATTGVNDMMRGGTKQN